jgi:hypothetical protein
MTVKLSREGCIRDADQVTNDDGSPLIAVLARSFAAKRAFRSGKTSRANVVGGPPRRTPERWLHGSTRR